jgi:N-carbamoyl-L-amino-acid hydrolase
LGPDLGTGTPLVDGPTLLGRVEVLAGHGGTPEGGVTRESFDMAFVTARQLLGEWFAAAKLDVTVDAAGNLLGCRPGRQPGPALLVGSHLDTVVDGGRLDGAYGILGGLSALEALATAGTVLDHPVVLAAFVNEEGAGGTPAMTGSRALAGLLGPADLVAQDELGRTIGELVGAIGGNPHRISEAAWPSGSIGAYLELHIEQGPVLERHGDSIGVVTAITGRTLIDIEVQGEAVHAGTTPMQGRRDALVAAAHLVLVVEALAQSGEVRVATIGVLSVEPGSRNTVPGRVHLSAELRDEDAGRMARAVDLLREAAVKIVGSAGVGVHVEVVDVVAPCPTDEALTDDLAASATDLGIRCTRLSSGAGHDAQSFAGCCPIGMLFVPSIRGLSHAAGERTEPSDLVLGATVLALAIAKVDQRLSACGPWTTAGNGV